MKKIFLLLLMFSLFCCQEKQKEVVSEVSLVDKEKVIRNNEVVIRVNDTIASFFTNLFVDEMQDMPDMLYLGSKDGKMTAEIPTVESIKIAGGNPMTSFYYELELEKGDSLLIDLQMVKINDTRNVAYPIFSIPNSDRKWSALNFSYLLYKYNLEQNAIVIDEEDKFRNNVYNSKYIYNNAIKLLDSLNSGNYISNSFYESEKTNQKLKFASFKVSEAKRENIEYEEDLGINPNNENLVANNEYMRYLRALILYKYFGKEKRVLNSTQFDFINKNETFLKGSVRQAMLDSYLKSIFLIEKSKFNEYLNKFNNSGVNDSLKNKWVEIIEKKELNKKKMNSSSKKNGTLTNLINSRELTFNEMLANHKGKIVLVDLWASWCAPCRKEMPYLKGLKSKFTTSELQVVEISIDKDYDAWVRASNVEGISEEENNYIISNWEKSTLYKSYNIKTIPRYLLFDKNGKIIDNNAPRPSTNDLSELIKANI